MFKVNTEHVLPAGWPQTKIESKLDKLDVAMSYELWVAILRKEIYESWVPFYELQIWGNNFCKLQIVFYELKI